MFETEAASDPRVWFCILYSFTPELHFSACWSNKLLCFFSIICVGGAVHSGKNARMNRIVDRPTTTNSMGIFFPSKDSSLEMQETRARVWFKLKFGHVPWLCGSLTVAFCLQLGSRVVGAMFAAWFNMVACLR
jgi:hypothetical protein